MYADDVTTAARFAARALSTPPPADPGKAARVRVFLADLASVLAQATVLATDRDPSGRGHTLVDLTRHPEQVLLDELTTLAAQIAPSSTGCRIGQSGARREAVGDLSAQPASARWAGYPTDPSATSGPVALWQGAVVHAFLAIAGLQQPGPPLPGPARWAVLGDTAALAQALAAAGSDLHEHPEPRHHQPADPYARLAVAAREVTHRSAHADGDRPIPAPAAARQVHIVTGPDVAPAVHQLARLLAAQPTRAEDLVSVVRVLAQTAHAAAAVLTRAANAATPNAATPDAGSPTAGPAPAPLTTARTAAPGAGPPAAASAEGGRLDPTTLRVAAAACTRHAEQLTAAVAAAHHRLASLDRASPLPARQAREIGATALPRLRAIATARIGDAALAAVPDILNYVAAAPLAARAAALALARLHGTGGLCVRDRASCDPVRPWRPAGLADLTGTLAALNAAVGALTPAARDVTALVAGSLSTAGRRPQPTDSHARGWDRGLETVLAQRHAARRPARPGLDATPAATGPTR